MGGRWHLGRSGGGFKGARRSGGRSGGGFSLSFGLICKLLGIFFNAFRLAHSFPYKNVCPLSIGYKEYYCTYHCECEERRDYRDRDNFLFALLSLFFKAFYRGGRKRRGNDSRRSLNASCCRPPAHRMGMGRPWWEVRGKFSWKRLLLKVYRSASLPSSFPPLSFSLFGFFFLLFLPIFGAPLSFDPSRGLVDDVFIKLA